MTDEIPADVAAVREEYEARILGLHMPARCARRPSGYGDQPAFSDRFDVPEGETWSTISWAETWAQTQQVAAALIDLGVETGDPVAIMATNRTAHTLADYGAMTAAAVPMSIYNTLAQDQVALHRRASRGPSSSSSRTTTATSAGSGPSPRSTRSGTWSCSATPTGSTTRA